MEVLEKEKLIVRDLYKNFDGKDVLKTISFTVHEGEFLSVLGPSGCGKTTLLRILIGLEQQTKGQILMDGEDISHLKPSERNMGIILKLCTVSQHDRIGKCGICIEAAPWKKSGKSKNRLADTGCDWNERSD